MTTLTTKDAADRLGIKPRSVVALIRRGLLAATRHGRDYAIDEAEVARYERQRRPQHRPKGKE
jgi:excisionase family DNA binding protein